jgi:GrpB protein
MGVGKAADERLERHPSLDERFDPAVRIVEYDAGWPLARRQGDQSSQGGAGYRRRAVGARGLGYLFVPALDSPDYHFFAKPPERPWTHHVHVCEAGSEHERRHLALRDFLRAHRDEAAGYTAFKRALAARHPQGRLGYIEGKDEYVTQLEARAVRWARGLS